MTQTDVNIYAYLLIYSLFMCLGLAALLCASANTFLSAATSLVQVYFLTRKSMCALIAHTLVVAGQADIARSI